MKVYKFGGASVKDAAAVKNVYEIIKSEKGNLAVVISAMGNCTNMLETLVKAYYDKNDRKHHIFSEFKVLQ